MKSFSELFKERANRIVALSKIDLIMLEALSQSHNNEDSKFKPIFSYMAERIPDHHQNHQEINIPEYKVNAFLNGMNLIATISEVEAYFQDIVIAVLLKHPEKIGNSKFELKTLLDIPSIQDVKQLAAEKYASEMLFKKPNEYKKDLISILSLDEKVFESRWPIFLEAKARRDIGVHNSWLVNDIYRAKIREIGLPAPTDIALSVKSKYLDEVRENCIEFMITLSQHCQNRFQ